MSTVDADRLDRSSILIHEVDYDSTGEKELSGTIIEAVATAEGVDPTNCDLELYEAVDLEALDMLFERRSRDGQWCFEFSVGDQLVVVEGDGAITIYET